MEIREISITAPGIYEEIPKSDIIQERFINCLSNGVSRGPLDYSPFSDVLLPRSLQRPSRRSRKVTVCLRRWGM